MRNSAPHGPALLIVCRAVLLASGACALAFAAAQGSGQDGAGRQDFTEKYRDLHAANRRPGMSFHAYYVRTVASGTERQQ